MSHDYGRRDGCFAAGMTDVGVGSGDLLGRRRLKAEKMCGEIMVSITTIGAKMRV